MINNAVNRITYLGDGTATEFAVTFHFLEKSDIVVVTVDPDDNETVLTKDYFVDLDKKTVIYPGYSPGEEPPEADRPPILPSGWKLVIYRDIAVTQESSLGDKWPFNVIEDALDKLTMICQDIFFSARRMLKLPESAGDDVDTSLPTPTPNASIYWDSTGKKLVAGANPNLAAADASASASAALQSEKNAKASETATAQSQRVAKDSEDAAASSKDAAAESKRDAANSAAAALASQNAAKTSETNANDSKVRAWSWAENTSSPSDNNDTASPTGKEQSSRSWALYSRDRAVAADTSAQAALASQKAAATSQSYALTSASNAAKSEAAAEASQEAAAESEANAKTSETNAANSAEEAKRVADGVGNPLPKADAEEYYLKKEDAKSIYISEVTGNGATLNVKKGNGISQSITIDNVKLSQSAAKLQTARNINGIAFDGTADITVPVGRTSLTVTGSNQTAWNKNVSGQSLSGYTLSRIPGVTAGTYSIADLIQKLVTQSHTHGEIVARGINCNCNCHCSD